MPTREYRCTSSHHFERMEKMSTDPLTECPKCGAPCQRVISGGAGVVFRGTGFYHTDYKNSK